VDNSHQSLETSGITTGCARLRAIHSRQGDWRYSSTITARPSRRRTSSPCRCRTFGPLHCVRRATVIGVLPGIVPNMKAIYEISGRRGWVWKASGANLGGRHAGHHCKSNTFKALPHAKRISVCDGSRICSCQILQIQRSRWIGLDIGTLVRGGLPRRESAEKGVRNCRRHPGSARL
jgi:hypothetical protein